MINYEMPVSTEILRPNQAKIEYINNNEVNLKKLELCSFKNLDDLKRRLSQGNTANNGYDIGFECLTKIVKKNTRNNISNPVFTPVNLDNMLVTKDHIIKTLESDQSKYIIVEQEQEKVKNSKGIYEEYTIQTKFIKNSNGTISLVIDLIESVTSPRQIIV